MEWLLKCPCGATAVVTGTECPETNVLEYNEDNVKWDGGNPDCSHEDAHLEPN